MNEFFFWQRFPLVNIKLPTVHRVGHLSKNQTEINAKLQHELRKRKLIPKLNPSQFLCDGIFRRGIPVVH